MYASDTTTWSAGTSGCATHNAPECLCDVKPLDTGVPIRSVPFAGRLLSFGKIDRYALLHWADDVLEWIDTQQELSLAAEA